MTKCQQCEDHQPAFYSSFHKSYISMSNNLCVCQNVSSRRYKYLMLREGHLMHLYV